MKLLAQGMTAAAFLMVLQGCELGSYSQTGHGSVLAGGGTTFSLATVQSIAPAFVQSFGLTGSDTTGTTWTGTFSVQNLPSTTFNGAAAVPRVQTLALTNTATNAVLNNQQTLYLGPGFQILGWTDNLTGVRCVPTATFATLPTTAGIGQSGVLGTLSCSDGSQRQYSWREDGATTAGLGILVLAATALDATGAQLSTEEDGYVVDAAGGIHGFTFFSRDFLAGTALTLKSPVT